MSKKIAIVVPSHIPMSEAWIESLQTEAADNEADVIIVEDGGIGQVPADWIVLTQKDQMEFMGDLYTQFAKIFHHSSACRNFGHLWAYKNGYEIIIGLDNDCIVKRGFVRDHKQFIDSEYGYGWFNPIGYPHYSRGFPYSQRNWRIKANMGLWENVLDINGKDRKPNEPKDIKIVGSTVPASFFPFSGMNFAVHRDAILGFLFLPNFDFEQPLKAPVQFRRIDDVWGGYIFQKLMQKMHYASMVGYPFVFHDTIVVPEEDEANEEAMCTYEDRFIELVDEACNIMPRPNLGKSTMAEQMLAFLEAIESAYNMQQPFDGMREAFDFWKEAIKRYA